MALLCLQNKWGLPVEGTGISGGFPLNAIPVSEWVKETFQDQFSGDKMRTSSNQLLHGRWQVLFFLVADQLNTRTTWEKWHVTHRLGLSFILLSLSISMTLFSVRFIRNPGLQKSPRLTLFLWTVPLLTVYIFTQGHANRNFILSIVMSCYGKYHFWLFLCVPYFDSTFFW